MAPFRRFAPYGAMWRLWRHFLAIWRLLLYYKLLPNWATKLYNYRRSFLYLRNPAWDLQKLRNSQAGFLISFIFLKKCVYNYQYTQFFLIRNSNFFQAASFLIFRDFEPASFLISFIKSERNVRVGQMRYRWTDLMEIHHYKLFKPPIIAF